MDESQDVSQRQIETTQVLEEINNLLADDRISEALPLIKDLHYIDIAELINSVHINLKTIIIDEIINWIDSRVLVYLGPGVKQFFIDYVGESHTALMLSTLEVDEVIYIIEDLNIDLQQNILSLMNNKQRKAVSEVLSYPENSIGRVMKTHFVSLPGYWTVNQALDYIRETKSIPESLYEIFIVDSKFKPVGIILLNTLLRKPSKSLLSEIMDKNLQITHTDVDQEEVSFFLRKYEIDSAPVVNKDGKLVGIISINEMVDIISEQANEALLNLGGTNYADDLTLSAPSSAKLRFPWLFVSLVSASMSSFVIHMFQDVIAKAIILASIMPVIVTVTCNAGTQTVTLMIKSLANKELNKLNSNRIFFKEIAACALNGIIISLVGIISIIIFCNSVKIGILFGVAVIFSFIIAGLLGVSIPIILEKIGFDPAISSTVILSSLTDMVGFFTFLLLASIFL